MENWDRYMANNGEAGTGADGKQIDQISDLIEQTENKSRQPATDCECLECCRTTGYGADALSCPVSILCGPC